MRKCIDCPYVAMPGGSRCESCQTTFLRKKAARKKARYNAEYDKVRCSFQKLIDVWAKQGRYMRCARCHKEIKPVNGKIVWDLDHLDEGTLAPSHAHCNRSAGGKNAFKKLSPFMKAEILRKVQK